MSPHNSLSADILQLDELEILVVVDNETDTLSSVDVGVPRVPEVIHLAAPTPSSRQYEGTMPGHDGRFARQLPIASSALTALDIVGFC